MTAVVVVQVKVKKMNVDNGSRKQSFYSLVWGMPLEREMFGVSHTYAIEMEGVCALVFFKKTKWEWKYFRSNSFTSKCFLCRNLCVFFRSISALDEMINVTLIAFTFVRRCNLVRFNSCVFS